VTKPSASVVRSVSAPPAAGCLGAAFLGQLLEAGEQRARSEAVQLRVGVPVDLGQQVLDGARALLQRLDQLGLALPAMAQVLLDEPLAVAHRRAVRRVQRRHRRRGEPLQAGEVRREVALGRVDDDRADRRQHVADQRRAVAALAEAEVAAVVAGRVDRLQFPAGVAVGRPAERDAVAVADRLAEAAARRQPFERQLVAAHGQVEGLAQRRDAADVVGVVVGGDHAFDARAAARQFRQQVEQALLLVGVGRARVDDPQALVADDAAVRRRRRRQGRRAQRRQHDAGREADLVQPAGPVALGGGVDLAREVLEVGGAREMLQQDHHRRHQQQVAVAPRRQRLLGQPPAALHEFAAAHVGARAGSAGGAALERHVEEHGVVAHRRERRRLHAAQRAQRQRRRCTGDELLPRRRSGGGRSLAGVVRQHRLARGDEGLARGLGRRQRVPHQASFLEQLAVRAGLQRVGEPVGGRRIAVLAGERAAGQCPVAAEEAQFGGALDEEDGAVLAVATGHQQGCGGAAAHPGARRLAAARAAVERALRRGAALHPWSPPTASRARRWRTASRGPRTTSRQPSCSTRSGRAARGS
jgi:hypothetical protein